MEAFLILSFINRQKGENEYASCQNRKGIRRFDGHYTLYAGVNSNTFGQARLRRLLKYQKNMSKPFTRGMPKR